MKTLYTLSIKFLGILYFLLIAGFSQISEPDAPLSNKGHSFNLSGTITNGHPDISWNPVIDADEYVVTRTPIPATGYSADSFVVSVTSFVDQGVNAVSQSGGFCQIRYTVSAYDGNTLLDTSNPIEFITTPNSEVIDTGECREP